MKAMVQRGDERTVIRTYTTIIPKPPMPLRYQPVLQMLRRRWFASSSPGMRLTWSSCGQPMRRQQH